MTDDKIKTKRLTDWKPETDIRLQKAFGKFVEEAGELLDALSAFSALGDHPTIIIDLENEIADYYAVTGMVNHVLHESFKLDLGDIAKSATDTMTNSKLPIFLSGNIGKNLIIVGRCQIQGIKGKDPETGILNLSRLEMSLNLVNRTLEIFVHRFGLDKDRIEKRKQAKIDSKLPWVMGTATDLLPDD